MPRRKKKKEINIFPEDKSFFRFLANCGYVSKEQLLSLPDSSYEQMKRLKRSKLVLEENSHTSEGLVYKISEKGKKIAEKEFGIKHFCFTSDISHDVMLADKYLSLSDSEKETFLNKTALNAEFFYQIKKYAKKDYIDSQGKNYDFDSLYSLYKDNKIVRVDCGYISDSGERIGYSIPYMGENYDDAMRKFCEILDYKFIKSTTSVPKSKDKLFVYKGRIRKINIFDTVNSECCTFDLYDKDVSNKKCVIFGRELAKSIDLLETTKEICVIGRYQNSSIRRRIIVEKIYESNSNFDDIKCIWIDGREKDLKDLQEFISKNSGSTKVNIHTSGNTYITSVTGIKFNWTIYNKLIRKYDIRIKI